MRTFICFFLIIILTAAVQAQPDGWQVNSADFEYSMTLTAEVEYDGNMLGAENDYVAAFVGTECRGVAQASFVEEYDTYMFFLTVFSNEYNGEEVSFAYYQQSEDNIIDDFISIIFTEGENIGTASSPFIVSDQEPVVELSASAIDLFYNDNDQLLTESVQITNIGGGLLNYTTSLKSGNWASINSTPIELGAQETADITVTADITGLTDGTYIDTLVIEAAETYTVPILLTIQAPVVDLSATEIALFSNENDQLLTESIQITNTGGGILTYATSLKSGTWASLTTTPAELTAQETADITVTADITGLADDIYNDTLVIGAAESYSIPVTLTVGGSSIAHTSAFSCSVFPNPAAERVKIQSDMAVQNIEIYNITGKTVQKHTQLNKNAFSVDISGLNPGVYIMRINSGQNNSVKRLTVK